MRRWTVSILVFVLSVGWIVPLSIAAWSCWRWYRFHTLIGGDEPDPAVNSFPFLTFAEQTWWMAVAWFGIAVVFWVIVGTRRTGNKILAP